MTNTAEHGDYKELIKAGKPTRFSKTHQPLSENKSKGIIKRQIKESLKGAMMDELAKSIIDMDSGEEYSQAEMLVREIIKEWRETKDPRYFKIITDLTKNEPTIDDNSNRLTTINIRGLKPK